MFDMGIAWPFSVKDEVFLKYTLCIFTFYKFIVPALMDPHFETIQFSSYFSIPEDHFQSASVCRQPLT
jgi:hypothetical protein